METYNHKGIYGDGTVYVMRSLADFDEYEEILKANGSLYYNPNFYEFKKDFKKYIGKIKKNRDTGIKYKFIAMEDDCPNADWYYVIQNVDDERDIEYVLCNGSDAERLYI